MAASGRRSTFAFDLSKPLKKGTLLKQGALHKAFKHRFFVLYPGFLVYYDDATKWKLDMTRGETLGSRLGAVKLRNGSASIARSAPKGCKFGLIVHAPDPTNKRITYLLNATSKPERDEWIEAIKQATPLSKNSPIPVRKDVKPAKPDSKRKEEKELQPPHPTYTQRQTTADVAALHASQAETESDKVTSIDEQVAPSITIRHDTANTAALLGSSESPQLVEEKEEPVTSIDAVLGPKLNGDVSSEEESSRASSVTDDTKNEENGQEDIVREEEDSRDQEKVNGEEHNQEKLEEHDQEKLNGEDLDQEKLNGEDLDQEKLNGEDLDQEKLNGEDLDQEKLEEHDQEKLNGREEEDKEEEVVKLVDAVQSSLNGEEISEVVTTVTVAVTVEAVSNGAESKEQAEVTESTDSHDMVANGNVTHRNGSTEELEAQNGGESIKSAEVSFKQEENSNLFSVTMTGMDDSTSSDEDDSPGSPGSAEGRSSPPTPLISVDRVPTLHENKKQETEGAEKPADPEKKNGKNGNTSSDQSTDALSPKTDGTGRRRSSTPFMEKTGYLYKMGGHRANWKLRYFVLQPGVFTYYKKKSSNAKSLGEVKLKNLQIFFPGLNERKQSFQFTVHTESSWNKRSDWVLAGQSEREMKEWISAFKVAGMKVSPPGSDDDTDLPTSNGAVSRP